MVKILAIGDQHFQPSNTEEIEEFLGKLEKYLEENKFDIIVSGGDLLHTHERLFTQSLNKAIQYIDLLTLHAPTYILVGNHDMIDCTQFLTDEHWLNVLKGKKNLTVVDRIITEKLLNVQITFAPYVPDGRFVEALNLSDSLITDWHCSKMIFCHQLFNGVKMGAIVARDVEDWKEEYPYICCFHVHDKQTVQDNMFYTGTPFQHAYGESSDKTITVFTISDSIEKDEVNLKMRKRYNIYLDISEVNDWLPKKNSRTRLSLRGTYEQYKAFNKTSKYKELQQLGVRITFNNRVVKEETKNNKEIKEMSEIKKTENRSFGEIMNAILFKENKDIQDLYKKIIPKTMITDFNNTINNQIDIEFEDEIEIEFD